MTDGVAKDASARDAREWGVPRPHAVFCSYACDHVTSLEKKKNDKGPLSPLPLSTFRAVLHH